MTRRKHKDFSPPCRPGKRLENAGTWRPLRRADTPWAGEAPDPGFRRRGGIHLALLATTGWGCRPGSDRRERRPCGQPAGRGDRKAGPSRGCSPVESEGELVEVVVEVRFADAAVVRPQPPTLQKGGHSVNTRHGHLLSRPSRAAFRRVTKSDMADKMRLRRVGLQAPLPRPPAASRFPRKLGSPSGHVFDQLVVANYWLP